MGDFNTDHGDVQGVEPGTKAPRKSGKPTTGFSNPGNGQRNRADYGPGEAIPGNTRKVH
jgi:hypothetical protein